ncbi:MAG: hypothetical protein WCD42_03090 [Rhizomicrobium sp.]
MSDPRTNAAMHADMSYMLFRDAANALRAVPLIDVARIEMVAPDAVENANGHSAICSQGHCIPIETIAGVPLPKTLPVLIFRQGHREMGLVVRQTADIVHGENALVVGGVPVSLFDIGPYMAHAFAAMPEMTRCPRHRGPPAGDRLALRIRGALRGIGAAARHILMPPAAVRR